MTEKKFVPRSVQLAAERQAAVATYDDHTKNLIRGFMDWEYNQEIIAPVHDEILGRAQKVADSIPLLRRLGFVDEIGRNWDVNWEKDEKGRVDYFQMIEVNGNTYDRETHTVLTVAQLDDPSKTSKEITYLNTRLKSTPQEPAYSNQRNNDASIDLIFRRMDQFLGPFEKLMRKQRSPGRVHQVLDWAQRKRRGLDRPYPQLKFVNVA